MLELSKNMCSLDAEYNELLDKVTSFTKYVSGCGDSGRIMMNKVCDEVNEITSIKERFAVTCVKRL